MNLRCVVTNKICHQILFPQFAQRKKTKKNTTDKLLTRMKCCLYKTPYVAATMKEQGGIIARTPPYAWLPSDAPIRTRIFLVHKKQYSQETRLVEVLAPTSLFYEVATCKSSTIKGLLYTAKAVPSKDYFMHLTLKNARKGC